MIADAGPVLPMGAFTTATSRPPTGKGPETRRAREDVSPQAFTSETQVRKGRPAEGARDIKHLLLTLKGT